MDADGEQAHTATVEDRLMTAVANDDEVAYATALRSARVFTPHHVAGGQSYPLLLDMDGYVHTAVFTSAELASAALARYAGGTAAWRTPDQSAEQLVKAFFERDQRLLVNPGTMMQQAFTVSDLVRRWGEAGLAVPRRRRGSIKAASTLFAFALLAFLLWADSTSGEVMCGHRVMSPDDTCVTVTSTGNSIERDYEETRSGQQRSATFTLVVGSVLAAAGLSVLVARIVTAVPRRGEAAR